MKPKGLIITIIVVVALIGGAVFLSRVPDRPGTLDTFASCLAEKGAMFYGAFWCPHCNDQKALFGRSQSNIPYTECSTPDGEGQLQVCTDKGITGYPTWEFADGTRQGGVLSLEALGERTSCPVTFDE